MGEKLVGFDVARVVCCPIPEGGRGVVVVALPIVVNQRDGVFHLLQLLFVGLCTCVRGTKGKP